MSLGLTLVILEYRMLQKRLKSIFSSVLIVLALFGVSACVSYSPSVSPSYTGPTATIADSFARQTAGRANFFVLKEVDGKLVENALSRSAAASYGQGNTLSTVGKSRQVEVREQKLTLLAQVYSAAPIAGMFNSGKNYSVEGVINFSPESNASYTVKGKLDSQNSLVWLEDADGNIRSEIVGLKATDKEDLSELVLKENVESGEKTPYQYFIDITPGQELSMVAKKLGKAESIKIHKANFLSNRPEVQDHKYTGLGTIRFTKSGDELFVQRVVPLAQATVDAADLSQQLKSEGAVFQSLARQFYQVEDLDVEKQDLIAEEIWQRRNAEDRYTEDAIAWLCKTIGKHGNPRYKKILEEVAETSTSSKIRKYALSASESIPAPSSDATSLFRPEK